MLSEKQMKREDIDARYCNEMSLVKWVDTKPVMMLSTIDSGNPENIVTNKRRLIKKQLSMAMIERVSGKFYCRPFWECIDIGFVNSFIVY